METFTQGNLGAKYRNVHLQELRKYWKYSPTEIQEQDTDMETFSRGNLGTNKNGNIQLQEFRNKTQIWKHFPSS